MSKIQAKQEIREVKKSEDKEKIPLKLETDGSKLLGFQRSKLLGFRSANRELPWSCKLRNAISC